MLTRVLVVALNAFREAVRARVLHGLFALAFGTAIYSLIVAAYSLRRGLRTIGDVGAASISIFALVVAVVLAGTSLYRELELKTIFPVLARPIRRSEYLVGKYLGIVLTVAVFVSANTGITLLLLGASSSATPWLAPSLGVLVSAVALAVALRVPRASSAAALAWAAALPIMGWPLAEAAADDRWVIVGLSVLSLLEVLIVTAIAMLCASFSSPYLTAAFTFSLVVVGRSAETLAHMPPKLVGPLAPFFSVLSHVLPNLMVYVPPRSVLTGEAADVHFQSYLALAVVQSVGWSVLLLACAAAVFRKRDFL